MQERQQCKLISGVEYGKKGRYLYIFYVIDVDIVVVNASKMV